MKIAITSDHAGFDMKENIKEALADRYEWLDLGTDSTEPANYADYGDALGQTISRGAAEYGIAICGSGTGIAIAANRYAKVRTAPCTGVDMARAARAHNNANVLALGARFIGLDEALKCVEAFMTTDYEGGRHDARVKKLGERGI